MYVNLHNENFDARSCFAFLRHSEEEVILIVANFAHSSRRCDITIPSAAFDAAGIPEGELPGTDMLSDKAMNLIFCRDATTGVEVRGRSAVIWRWRRRGII